MPNSSTHSRVMLPAMIALFIILVLTLLMGKKHGYTVDANAPFQITQEIISTGKLFPQTAVKQGYLYSIVYIPFYLLAQPLHQLFPDVPLDYMQRKMLCWMNAVWTGLAAAVLCCLLQILGYSKRVQIILPLIYAFSTLAFTYSRYDYNKSLATFFLISSFYLLIRHLMQPSRICALWCGLFLALLICIRLEMGVLVLPFLYALFLSNKLNDAILMLIPFMAGVAFVLGYNAMYWQAELSGGYEGSFTLNLFPAIIGVLFSPGKSLFVFNPVLLLMPLTARFFWVKHEHPVRMVWLGSVACLFLLYCFWGNWWGGWGYGARHFVPLIPLLILPLAECFSPENRKLIFLLAILFIIGVVVQMAGAAIAFHDVIHTLMQAGFSEEQLIWLPQLNPVTQHLQFMQAIPLPHWDLAVIPFLLFYPATVTILVLGIFILLIVATGYWLIRHCYEQSL